MTQSLARSRLDLSVVVLAYKEGEGIKHFVSALGSSLDRLGIEYELILVANHKAGSGDQTPRIVEQLARENARIVAVSKPKLGMYGWDLRSGLEQTRGDTVAYIDGDGQMPPEDVARVYTELTETGSDMALTYRTKRHDPLRRTFISKIYNILLRILFPCVKVFDANAKPKIFTRQALGKLRLVSDDWFIDAEAIIQATENNFKIAQIPTIFLKNNARASFVNFTTLFEFLWNLVRYRFSR